MKPAKPHGSDDGVGHDDSEYLHNAEVAHEHGDVDVRSILMFLLGLSVLTGAVMLLMAGVFVGLERMAAAGDPQISPVAIPAGELPPEPRLLTNEPLQLRRTREAEAAALGGGGDAAAGTARLSIEEAKKQVVTTGLPTRGGAPVDRRLGTHAPASGESSGGRVLGGAAPAAAAGQQPVGPAPAPAHPKGH